MKMQLKVITVLGLHTANNRIIFCCHGFWPPWVSRFECEWLHILLPNLGEDREVLRLSNSSECWTTQVQLKSTKKSASMNSYLLEIKKFVHWRTYWSYLGWFIKWIQLFGYIYYLVIGSLLHWRDGSLIACNWSTYWEVQSRWNLDLKFLSLGASCSGSAMATKKY